MKKNSVSRLLLMIIGLHIFGSTPVWSADTEQTVAMDACVLPIKPAATQEETAWQLFVAINCKIKNNQLTWETWKTQECLNSPVDCPKKTIA